MRPSEKAFELFGFKKKNNLQEESELLKEKVGLVLEILGGEVVEKPIRERLSPEAVWLKHFLIALLPEDFGESQETYPLPGDCTNCPAAKKRYYDWPEEVLKKLKRKPGYYCFGDALFVGKGKKVPLITDKMRAKCPLVTLTR